MKWTLMHKNIPVVDMTTVDSNGSISNFGIIHNYEHLPVGTVPLVGKDSGKLRKTKLDEWWSNRSIPGSREGLYPALRSMGLKNAKELLLLGNALSLSDHYWVKPFQSDIKWENINYFDNDFSLDVGKALFGHGIAELKNINKNSPNSTSPGNLMKQWLNTEPRMLQKAGSNAFLQEPFNEYIAYKLADALNVSHIKYEIGSENDQFYSLCDNFVTKDTELVSAWSVLACFELTQEDFMEQTANCAGRLGIGNIRNNLDKMLTLDYIIANGDRHFNNFGFLRNPNTLEWQGFAPLYDSGASLWYNKTIGAVGVDIRSEATGDMMSKQLNLVSDLSWLQKTALTPDVIIGDIRDILDLNVISGYVEKERNQKIAMELANRYDIVLTRAGVSTQANKPGIIHFAMPEIIDMNN